MLSFSMITMIKFIVFLIIIQKTTNNLLIGCNKVVGKNGFSSKN